MSRSIFTPPSLPGVSIASQGPVEDACTKEPEIKDRLARVDQALGELKNAVEVLTDRLSPVMTETGNGSGSDEAESICATPIGQRLQAQESFVRNATNAVQSILYRLEI